MKFDKVRADWVNRSKPVTGPAFPSWSAIKRIVIHYPGADWASMDFNRDGVLDYRDTAVLMDNTNNYYWSRTPAYAIGYNAAADAFGITWELRGDSFMCAANKGVNDTSFAILVIVDDQAPATPAQIEAVRRLVAEVQVLAGWQVPIVGHGEVGSTSCPGLGIRTQIAAGAFEPRVSIPAPILRLGDRGPRVRVLRDHLVFWKMQKRAGVFFGTGTRAAVRRWQRSLGVKVTGVYDIATHDAYAKAVGK
jgi:hypothetical protein